VVSFSTTLSLPTVSLGQNHAGGIVFYIDQTGQHGLVCHSIDVGSAPWGLLGTDVLGTQTNIGSGSINTGIITLFGVNYPSIAAFVCDTLQVNGYSDWFLPSRDELHLVYNNIHFWGLGSFQNTWYWSSSQWNINEAWSINFNDGYVGSHPHQWVGGLQKNLTNRIIAVRAF